MVVVRVCSVGSRHQVVGRPQGVQGERVGSYRGSAWGGRHPRQVVRGEGRLGRDRQVRVTPVRQAQLRLLSRCALLKVHFTYSTS